VLESGKRLLVLVPLLIGAWSNCIWASGQTAACSTRVSPRVEMDSLSYPVDSGDELVRPYSCDATLLAGGLLEPSIEAAAVLSSSSLPSLPAAPKSILMALVGFLCVSLVRDGKIWLAVAASLLPVDHYRPNAVTLLSSPQQGKRLFGHPAGPEISSVPCERVPLNIRTYSVPQSRGGATAWDVLPAIASPRSTWNELLSCLASDLSPTWSVSSPFFLAQLARGPPRWPPRTSC
jgi:hypothetical protein